jgi:hypothetical protein
VAPYETVEVEASSVVHVIVAEVRDVEDATRETVGGVRSGIVITILALDRCEIFPAISFAQRLSVLAPSPEKT